ncbi:MAG: Ig-like domain-containing protein [Myxococcales bacterium]|nr:Ig-like domain-containing protein [Myxococcales bacterium]
MAQNHARFPAADTYWLPGPASCGAWQVQTQPSGATAKVIAGVDGHSRVTPLTPGTWRFSRRGVTRELMVVPASERPFHNFSYYPSRALTKVGEEVWAVSTLRHEVIRLDAVTLANQGTVTVGSWPVALAATKDVVLVVQRGSDTLGFIDAKTARLVDAIWVGDEPSNIVLSPDKARAYVTLATAAQVAVVDVAKREVVERWDGPADPLGLAISPDGKQIAVASHRSGHTDRFPWGTDPKEEERDIALLDTTTGQVTRWLMDAGTTLRSLAYRADGKRLYAALTRNDIRANLANLEEKSFEHLVVAFDTTSGAEVAKADLSRQTTSAGYAVALHGLSLGKELLWVAAEASDVLVGLDPTSLAEVRRVVAPGRPRTALAIGGSVWAHGGQALAVHRYPTSAKSGSKPVATGGLGIDPRSEEAAAGQRYFTGAGRDYAQNWACNTCHTDGLTDTLTWNAGPFASRLVTRSFFWLEGTWPLGWQGYLSSIRNYAFTVNTNVGVRPTTDEAERLSAYLSSLMPPPAANGRTARDGGLSKEALVGKKLYEGKAKCVSCHALPLTTNQARFDNSITPGSADVPSLVGSYRQGVWLKHGEARTLRAGVEAAATWSKVSLSDKELDAVTRYVSELTARDFFLLTSTPRNKATGVAADRPVELVLSHPVWADSSNLQAITLEDAGGEPIEAVVSGKGRHLAVAPSAPLQAGASYTVVVGKALRSWDDRGLFAEQRVAFTVAAAPKLKLSGDYRWTVDMPVPKPDLSGFNPTATAPTTVVFYTSQRDSGADVVVDYGDGLVYNTAVTVNAGEIHLPPLPVPVGPSFADSFGTAGALVDDDGDGIADGAKGTLTIAGPGFELSGVKWRMTRPPAIDGCTTGAVDKANIQVQIDAKGRPVVSWDDGKTGALGVYVTEPGANLPFGPGQKVTGGKTWWAATAVKFPGGFKGPVTMGVLPDGAQDVTADQGGTAGGVPLPAGACVQFGVISTKFEVLLFRRAF